MAGILATFRTFLAGYTAEGEARERAAQARAAMDDPIVRLLLAMEGVDQGLLDQAIREVRAEDARADEGPNRHLEAAE